MEVVKESVVPVTDSSSSGSNLGTGSSGCSRTKRSSGSSINSNNTDPFPKDKFWTLQNSKEFADDNFKFDENC